jgi:hypothetical protein
MTRTKGRILEIDIATLTRRDLDPLRVGETAWILLGLPSHGTSGSDWDVFHDVACAVYVIHELSPSAEIEVAEMREKRGVASLAVRVLVREPEGMVSTLRRVCPIWSDDDAQEDQRMSLGDDVLDYAESVQDSDLSIIPSWLGKEFLRLREIAQEETSSMNEE